MKEFEIPDNPLETSESLEKMSKLFLHNPFIHWLLNHKRTQVHTTGLSMSD